MPLYQSLIFLFLLFVSSSLILAFRYSFFFTGHCHIKGHLFKLGLVNSPECNRCKQASETASHVLCDGEALVTLRFRHLGLQFMKPGDFEDISVSKILHFVEGAGLLND
jgi:hypothetical protein